MQPGFLTRMRRSIEQAFGERRHTCYPGASALRAGVGYVASSDAPTGAPSPWLGMADAVTRGAADGAPIGPQEALSPREAFGAYAHGGAYAMKHETWRGTLTPEWLRISSRSIAIFSRATAPTSATHAF